LLINDHEISSFGTMLVVYLRDILIASRTVKKHYHSNKTLTYDPSYT
jgi:hypothetical protein